MTSRALLLTFIALLVLAAASFGLSFVHLGRFGMAAALFVSVIKATLVVLIFMELVHESFASKAALVTAVAFIALIVSLMIGDVEKRDPPLVRPNVLGSGQTHPREPIV